MGNTATAFLIALSTTACVASGSGTFGSGSTGPGPAPAATAGGDEGSYGGPASANGGATGAGPAAGPTEPRWDDFAFAVRERTGTYHAPWVMTKMTTFKVGKSCYDKLGEKDSGSLNNAGYYTRSVHALAKAWTGEDWEAVENQRGDRAKDRTLVEPMMNEFAKRFHMTISVEGEDCETERDALWIRYWYTIGESFEKYPPLAGKLDVQLNVTAAARDISVNVDESGSVFEITAPRDIEAKDWNEKIEKPFRKNAKKL